MTGRIDIFIPRTADGELMTGPVPKHRLPKVRGIDVRTFFDPLADRNLPNAIPAPKAKPMPACAPRGWRLRPVVEAEHAAKTSGHMGEAEVVIIPGVVPEPVGCPRCARSFRKSGVGLAWHIANALECGSRKAA